MNLRDEEEVNYGQTTCSKACKNCLTCLYKSKEIFVIVLTTIIGVCMFCSANYAIFGILFDLSAHLASNPLPGDLKHILFVEILSLLLFYSMSLIAAFFLLTLT